MKTTKIFSILAVLAFVLTGCQDDFGKKFSPAKVGDDIVFGGTAGYNPEGRTIYGDRTTTGTEIKWYEGDQVRIYCAEVRPVIVNSKEQHYSDYNVVGGIPANTTPLDNQYEQKHSATLIARNIDWSLQWGSADTHTFYGVYPAPSQLSADGADQESMNAAGHLELTGNTLKGFLPNKQAPLSGKPSHTYANGTYTVHPSMRYAYMVAKNAATIEDGGVTLTFNPIVTAVEITLVNNSESKTYNPDGTLNKTTQESIKNINMLSVTSENVICGDFEAIINGGDNNKVTTKSTEVAYKTVSVPVSIEELKYGEKVSFTVFMVMTDKTSDNGLKNLRVSITSGATIKTANFKKKGDGLLVQAQRKNFITNAPLNLGSIAQLEEVNPSNWLKYIPNTDATGKPTYVKNLSIPGAGGATSKLIYDRGDNTSAQQSLSLSELWNQGIRCFEFSLDRNSSDLGKENIYCNLENTEVSLDNAVNQIAGLVEEHPEEFAVIIIGYQEKGVTSWDRNAGDGGFGADFNKWWKNYPQSDDKYTASDGTSKSVNITKGILSSSMTMADARGKVFMICRPVIAGIDGGWHTGISDVNYDSTNGAYLGILGWGNHADQWYARGFGSLLTANPTSSSQTCSKLAPSTNTMNRPYEVSTSNAQLKSENYTIPSSKSFAYKMSSTMGSSGSSYANAPMTAWVQEWRRVMPTTTLQSKYGLKTLPASANGQSNNSYYYNWSPSSDEKWADVVTTLDKTMKQDGKYALYINSLCGYFIDGSIAESYQPRATFQRYYGVKGWLTGDMYFTYGLDDKFYNDGNVNLTNDGEQLSGKSSPKSLSAGWGPYKITGGFKGNIGTYAHWINNLFYNHLLTLKASGGMVGGTGIVLMDRVSDNANENAAGYYIPRIILANNTFVVDDGGGNTGGSGDDDIEIAWVE